MIKSCLPVNCAVNKAVALTFQSWHGSVLIRTERLAACQSYAVWEVERYNLVISYVDMCWTLCGHTAYPTDLALALPVMKGLLFEIFGSWSKSLSLTIKSCVFPPAPPPLSFLLVFIDPLSHLEGVARGETDWLMQQCMKQGCGEREKKGCKYLTCSSTSVYPFPTTSNLSHLTILGAEF